jgi:hypothetical protein
MNRQNYMDLNTRPVDLADRIVMTGAAITGAIWLAWIIEGLTR